MSNHYHLLVKTRQENLSKAIQWLNISYASYYNWRHRRSGHLFQGRYKSFIVEDGNYLRQLILYIHRNPLRARVVDRLADYPWSSYLCLGYVRKCRPWLSSTKVLRYFENERSEFRKQIQAYSEEAERLLENIRQGLYLGAENAFERLMSKVGRSVSEEQPQSWQRKRGRDLKQFIEAARKKLKISPAELDKLRKPLRGQDRPLRDVLIYLAWKEGTFGLAVIGAYFNVRYTAISNARRRAETILKTDKALSMRLGAGLPK
jgi:putative transposase